MKPRILKNRFVHLVIEKEKKEGRLIRPTELAEAIKVTRPTIYAWLRNEVTKFEAPVLTRICDYFECDLCDLLYFETIEDEKTPDES